MVERFEKAVEIGALRLEAAFACEACTSRP